MHCARYILKGKDLENFGRNKSSQKIALFSHFVKSSNPSSQGSGRSWNGFLLHRCPEFTVDLDLGIFSRIPDLSSATPDKVTQGKAASSL